MARNHFIEVKNLVKNYGTGNIKVTAVDNVSFYVDKGLLLESWVLPVREKRPY